MYKYTFQLTLLLTILAMPTCQGSSNIHTLGDYKDKPHTIYIPPKKGNVHGYHNYSVAENNPLKQVEMRLNAHLQQFEENISKKLQELTNSEAKTIKSLEALTNSTRKITEDTTDMVETSDDNLKEIKQLNTSMDEQIATAQATCTLIDQQDARIRVLEAEKRVKESECDALQNEVQRLQGGGMIVRGTAAIGIAGYLWHTSNKSAYATGNKEVALGLVLLVGAWSILQRYRRSRVSHPCQATGVPASANSATATASPITP